MESLFERYRNLVVLLTLLLAQIVGLAMQVHRGESGHMSVDPRDSKGVRLLRLWADMVVSPPERLFHGIAEGTSNYWGNYFDLRHVREQNQQLQATVDRLRLEQAALLEDAQQGQRLQAILKFQEKYIYKTLPVQVIGTSGSEQSRAFFIDKGSDSGVERDMAVITADGIVGKVRDVFPRTAQVLAVNDQSSGAGVILETTRIRGILRGNAVGQPQIVGLMADSRIKPGERVLTAGGDEIFPRGLPVGTVKEVVPDPDQDGFIKVIVQPAAHLDRLDEVLVITSIQPRFPPDQQQDIATSEAEKGPEAEQENAQQKASEVLAERLPGLIEPNLPADQQPLNDDTNPNPVSRPPMPIHPDRFTPGANPNTDETGGPATAPAANSPDTAAPKPAAPAKSPAKPASKPQRNP
ncbi:MAG: rod shape-determining protein MreC [Terracidiphilus sp.]